MTMKSALWLLVVLWLPVSVVAQPVFGVYGNCDDSIEDHSLVGRLMRRIVERPLLAPRDGSLRRAAVSSIRQFSGGRVTLSMERPIRFADGLEARVEDLVYSVQRCFAAHSMQPEIVVSGQSVSLMGEGVLATLQGCGMLQRRSAEIFGEKFGIRGAYVASGPYEPRQWRPNQPVFLRFPDEGRGPERLAIACATEATELLSGIREGRYEAIYLPSEAVPAGWGAGDETVRMLNCGAERDGYMTISRNQSISCIEGLDPLAIIAR